MLAQPLPRPRNARGEKARALVLEAATALFAERGYQGVSLAEIAERAQVSKSVILYHYDGKEALWRACVDALWQIVDAFYSQHWPRDLPPSRRAFGIVLDLFVRAALAWPAYVRIPFIEGAVRSWRSEWLVERHFRAHVLTTDRMLRSCARRGLLRADDAVQAQITLTSGINVLIAQAAMWSAAFDRRVDVPHFLQTYVEHVLDLTFRPETLDREPD